MYRLKPGKFYCLTDNGAIVAFQSPTQRQRYVNEIIRVNAIRGFEGGRRISPELAALRGAVQVPEVERTAAYDRILRETRRMAALLTRSSVQLGRRLA